MSAKQKQFLIEKFNDGLLRGVRWQPEAVVDEMKKSKDGKTGKFIFTVSEFLKVSTVRSFFSRYNNRTRPLPNAYSSTSTEEKPFAPTQMQVAEEDEENIDTEDEEVYQVQLAIDVEIDRAAMTNMINNDPNIKSKRPLETLQ